MNPTSNHPAMRTLWIGAAVLGTFGLLFWLRQEKQKANPPAIVGENAKTDPEPRLQTVPTSVSDLPEAKPAASSEKSVPAIPITSSVMVGAPMVRTIVPVQPVPEAQAAPVAPPEDGRSEVDQVHAMVRDFRTRMRENPVGSNAEIMRAVMGANAAGARLGPPEGHELNELGELLDHWGKPYFFHQLSATVMEIRSAGPDGRMWTADDVVSK
jgi:hypothetical protein